MRYLRQSTSVDVPIGPFLDATDGVTAETGLTITQPDIRLKKNGGAWAQKNAAQTLTHEENGFYEVTLDATDTDTLGHLRLAVFESGAAPVWEDFEIVPAAVWDAWFAGTGNGVRADVQVIANDAITAAALASSAGGEIADAVWDEALSGHTTVGSAGQRLQAIRSGTAQAGAATTITLDAGASSTDDFYNDNIIVLTGGTGAGQVDYISDYVGSTKVATVGSTWLTNPDNTTTWMILPGVSSASLDAASIRAAVGLASANLDTQLSAANLDTQLADSIPSDGTRPTLRQAMYMVAQFMFERSVSGTTVTVRKVDGSTSLMTLTLNSATAPTSITRAT